MNLRITIPSVEQGFFFPRRTSPTHQTTTDKHQIALFGRKDWIIPIDNVKIVVGINQDIAGMNIRMTQNEFRRSGLKCVSQLFSAPDEIENLIALCHQKSRQTNSDRVHKGLTFNTHQKRPYDFAPLGRIRLAPDAAD